MVTSTKSSSPKKSGGPQTPEGKLVTSRNAIKTGAYCKTLILPGENESDFCHIQTQMMQDFAPQDMAENALVNELSVLMWKQIRLRNLEHRTVFAKMNKPPQDYEVRDYTYINTSAALSIWPELIGVEPRLDGACSAAIDFAQEVLDRGISSTDMEKMESEYEAIFQSLQMISEEYFEPALSGSQMCCTLIEDDEGIKVLFLPMALKQTIALLQEREWIWSNLEAVKKEITELQDERVLRSIRGEAIARTHNDVARSFFRALAELRKHQNWRLERSVVDLNCAASDTVERGRSLSEIVEVA